MQRGADRLGAGQGGQVQCGAFAFDGRVCRLRGQAAAERGDGRPDGCGGAWPCGPPGRARPRWRRCGPVLPWRGGSPACPGSAPAPWPCPRAPRAGRTWRGTAARRPGSARPSSRSRSAVGGGSVPQARRWASAKMARHLSGSAIGPRRIGAPRATMRALIASATGPPSPKVPRHQAAAGSPWRSSSSRRSGGWSGAFQARVVDQFRQPAVEGSGLGGSVVHHREHGLVPAPICDRLALPKAVEFLGDDEAGEPLPLCRCRAEFQGEACLAPAPIADHHLHGDAGRRVQPRRQGAQFRVAAEQRQAAGEGAEEARFLLAGGGVAGLRAVLRRDGRDFGEGGRVVGRQPQRGLVRLPVDVVAVAGDLHDDVAVAAGLGVLLTEPIHGASVLSGRERHTLFLPRDVCRASSRGLVGHRNNAARSTNARARRDAASRCSPVMDNRPPRRDTCAATTWSLDGRRGARRRRGRPVRGLRPGPRRASRHRCWSATRRPRARPPTPMAASSPTPTSRRSPGRAWSPNIPGWLLRADSPLRFRPRLDPAQWRWGLAFLARLHRRAVGGNNTPPAAPLLPVARPDAAPGARRRRSPSTSCPRGKLVVHSSEESFAAARRLMAFQAQHGSVQEALDSGGVRRARTGAADHRAAARRRHPHAGRGGGRLPPLLPRPLATCCRERYARALRLGHAGAAARRARRKAARGDDARRRGARRTPSCSPPAPRRPPLTRPLGLRLPALPAQGLQPVPAGRRRCVARRASASRTAARKVVYARIGRRAARGRHGGPRGLRRAARPGAARPPGPGSARGVPGRRAMGPPRALGRPAPRDADQRPHPRPGARLAQPAAESSARARSASPSPWPRARWWRTCSPAAPPPVPMDGLRRGKPWSAAPTGNDAVLTPPFRGCAMLCRRPAPGMGDLILGEYEC